MSHPASPPREVLRRADPESERYSSGLVRFRVFERCTATMAEAVQHQNALQRPLTASVGPERSDQVHDIDIQSSRPTTLKDNTFAPTNTNTCALLALVAIRGNYGGHNNIQLQGCWQVLQRIDQCLSSQLYASRHPPLSMLRTGWM